MKIIDFEKEAPYWINEDFKWYFDKFHQDYITTQQRENLPALKNLQSFIVKNEKEGVEDYVVVDDTQNIICSYPHTRSGADQLEARINIMKVAKHFDDYEKANNI